MHLFSATLCGQPKTDAGTFATSEKMKQRTIINSIGIIILLIVIGYLVNKNNNQKKELVKQENEINKFWEDKIAEYQFIVNLTYRDINKRNKFFDKLNNCYNLLRELLNKHELTETERKQITDFIFLDYIEFGHIPKEDLLKRLNVENQNQIYDGSKLEIVQRLDKVLNPYFMSGHDYIDDFDIWEKQDNFTYNNGDTLTFMVRLLRNHNLNSHQIEFIPSEELTVLKSNLGELRIIVPEKLKKGNPLEVKFMVYDWIRRDTILKKIYMNQN